MILAIKNNVQTVSASGDVGTSDPNNVKPFTFDKNYTSAGVFPSSNLNIDIVSNDNGFDYVGIAGHNIGTLGGLITVENHGVKDVIDYAPIDDRPLMFIVPRRTSGGTFDCIITVTKPANGAVIYSHVAVGDITDLTSTSVFGQIITNDFKAGFPRIPMGLGRKLKTSVNDQAAPMATLMQTIGQKVSLNIDNIASGFANTSLIQYQNFWVNNGFFIQNIEDEPNSSYMAFNFIPKPPKTHASTRNLVNVSYSFTTYNGL